MLSPLAGAVPARVVQLHRGQHQGPMWKRSAEVFACITRGSFTGLTVDHEEGVHVLLGVRPDAGRIAVAGMSQGTRDQLFLSLRLAAVEQHTESLGLFPVDRGSWQPAS
jgi:DNA repair protein SbcC/Rad50